MDALMATVIDELETNETSLAASIARHREIDEAIDEAHLAGSTQTVHLTAVVGREIWEPQTAALEALLTFQSQSMAVGSEVRIRLGTIQGLMQAYLERELRAAEFQDRTRERIAELPLPIYALDDPRRSLTNTDQVMLNYLGLRQNEERAAMNAGEALLASIRVALMALAR